MTNCKGCGSRMLEDDDCRTCRLIAAERDRCMKLAEECGAFGIADRIQRGAPIIDADGTVGRIDRSAVLAEREACAELAEHVENLMLPDSRKARYIAQEIRARGAK
jgi:predicted transcriptional regulator